MDACDNKVKARLRRTTAGVIVEVQRAKFKHWFRFGEHKASDDAFEKAFARGCIEWWTKILEDDRLF